jgi:phospholipid/cholesterol/gamma-HCH transport system substrate-binding protein
VTAALAESIPDVKQSLHVAPTALQNFVNIYEPANGAFTGVLALNNFANPVDFICGAVQAASRLNNEQSAKLCVQYLAPIVKNRQYNFFPIGGNPVVGAQARPNEVTFSENWLRPLTEAGRVRDFYEGPLPAEPVPPVATAPASVDGLPPPDEASAPPATEKPLPAEAATPTDPAAGLPGLMVPHGVGS